MKITEILRNEKINIVSIRVTDVDGSPLGIMPSREAYNIALDKNLDLVMVAPNALPPVCKIMDWGKHLFELKKKEKISKAKQSAIVTKEIQLRPTTDVHDIETKLRNAKKFLEKGNYVRFNMRFRGRENTHAEIGMAIMNDIIEQLGDAITIEKKPIKTDNNLSMIISQK